MLMVAFMALSVSVAHAESVSHFVAGRMNLLVSDQDGAFVLGTNIQVYVDRTSAGLFNGISADLGAGIMRTNVVVQCQGGQPNIELAVQQLKIFILSFVYDSHPYGQYYVEVLDWANRSEESKFYKEMLEVEWPSHTYSSSEQEE